MLSQSVDKPTNTPGQSTLFSIFILKYIIFSNNGVNLPIFSSNLSSNFSSFFIFNHAKVSAAFILILAFPIMLVYLKLRYSFALQNCLLLFLFFACIQIFQLWLICTIHSCLCILDRYVWLLLLHCFYFLYLFLDLDSFHIGSSCSDILYSLLCLLLSGEGFCFPGIFSSRLFHHICIVLDRMILYQFFLFSYCLSHTVYIEEVL